ncbi:MULTISPECIES: serine/threonine-protein kinase [unclassified Delftia]|uniref:serine/threonine-protein kinase n=1 Tax=unclassified Delftia TaxID=2613839 RepID=UPI0018FF2733|nr:MULTISPECIES: serine/threonine-protein kinase [unclassified Delftia]
MAGGMGAVQICADSALDRRVAIKFLQPGVHGRRIKDELAALLKMRSKHVVQVYDVLQFDGDQIGIVQEFIDGPDLVQSIVPPTDLGAFYRQLWQIASGIADIHALGVIHRDIKPNNMKVDPEGVVKIFDFGLARDDGPSAATMGFVGTLGFAAPELFLERSTFTFAADTYAFGATALFLALLGLPHSMLMAPPQPVGATAFTDLRIGTDPATALPLAEDVSEVLLSCMAQAPACRPSMSDVRDTLARHILHGRHQALLVFNGKASILNKDNRVVKLNYPNVGSAQIAYDGLRFVVQEIAGEVMINNQQVAPGYSIPGSCVVALGGAHRRGNDRKFITFDVAHPEIVL